jgi:hypothetical protein
MPRSKAPHVGSPELYDLGQALLAMFCYCEDEHQPTTFSTMKESPERHYDECPICGFDRVPGGSFTLRHQHKRLGIELPYLAAHVLAAHGHIGPQWMSKLDTLRELLNTSEQALGRRLVGLVSGAAPEPGLGFTHELVKGHHCCKHCDDALNLGTVTLSRGEDEFALSYIGLHTLYEHGDPCWADRDGKTGEVDIEALRKVVDAGQYLIDLGKRLASILPFLGGTERPPAWLHVDEHPLRGIESCQRCDATVNMGSFNLTDIRGPGSRTMTLPYLAVHTLVEHASAHYIGSLHRGTVDVRLLMSMLGFKRD